MDQAVSEALLSLQQVRRSFGEVEVLHGIDLELRPGEVHALIGENGAGKSTTMKILCGYLSATSGYVKYREKSSPFRDANDAEAQGVVMIHQEFNLAELLTVEQNIFLGRELRKGLMLDKASMQSQTRDLLDRLNCSAAATARIDLLSNSDKQMVEIAKALSRNAKVLVMDEPTAVLTKAETAVLFEQVEALRASGTAILFTSHKLDEVKQIADCVTVMRDGEMVHHGKTDDMSEDQMAEAMVGRDVSQLYPDKPKQQPHERMALSVKSLNVPGFAYDLSLDLHQGEILGLSGMIGSGRTESMEGLCGLRRAQVGSVEINGQAVKIRSTKHALSLGLCYLTEDRKGRGLLLNKSMRENLTLQALETFAKPLIDHDAEEKALDSAIAEFDIRAGHRQVNVGNLSGGNQQKLLIAKTMLSEPQIVIIDEPTRGIDIGTKQQIYAFIRELASQGKSVIVISSEMQEVIGLADRVLVMRDGRMGGELQGDDITEEQIVRLAMGLTATADTQKKESA